MEPSEIASIVEKISNSGMSVDEYLRKHSVPFGRPQYFRYKARLTAEGLDGLRDGRSKGNHRKLTPDAEGYLRGVHQTNPRLSLQEICESLESTLGIEVDRSTVSRFLRGVGEQIEWPRPQEPESQPCMLVAVTGANPPDDIHTLFLPGFVRFFSSLDATTMTAGFIGGIGYLRV